MDQIDAEVLITLVEVRPVLWDKTLDVYKDQNATKNTWREVCLALKQDFDVMEDKDKNAFGKGGIRRSTNLRDSFVKSNIKIQATKKSGSAAKILKKYVYCDQLQFLKKLYNARETEDSFQSESAVGLEEDTETQGFTENIENAFKPFDTLSTQITPKKVRQTKPRKHRKPDEIEMKMLRALEVEKPCSKTSFLLSLKPHLDKFDEQDYLQFQMGVLKVIENINERKKTISAQPPPVKQHTPSVPYNQFPTYSHSPMTNSAFMTSYHTLQNYPPPATPNPRFSYPPEEFNNPNVFSAQQLQTPQSRSSYQQGNKVPSPRPSPSTSSNECPPSTTQSYGLFAESLSSQSDNAISPADDSTPDTFDFSSS